MGYTLRVNHPSLGQGRKLQIPGLGEFVNGKVHKLEDEAVQVFESLYGSIEERTKNCFGVELEKTGGEDRSVPVNNIKQEGGDQNA